METEKNDVNNSGSTLDDQEEEYKYKYEYYYPKFSIIKNLNNVPSFVMNLQRHLISITISQTAKTNLWDIRRTWLPQALLSSLYPNTSNYISRKLIQSQIQKQQGKDKIFVWMKHKIDEVYRNQFNFRDNEFIEPSFGFYLILFQTILHPLLQAPCI